MQSTAETMARHPRVALTVIAALTVFFALALPRLEIRTDGAAIHPQDSPAVRATAVDQARFHDPNAVLVLLRSRQGGPRLTTRDGFAFLAEAHDSLAALPGVVGSGVRSVSAWPDPRAAAAMLAPRGALDRLPDSDADAAQLAARLQQDPFVRGLLLSADGRVTALEVPLDAGTPRRLALAAIQRWVRRLWRRPLRAY